MKLANRYIFLTGAGNLYSEEKKYIGYWVWLAFWVTQIIFLLENAATASESLPSRALALACNGNQAEILNIQSNFPGSYLLDVRVQKFRGRPGKSYHILGLSEGGELRISRLFPNGKLRRISIEHYERAYNGRFKPISAAIGNGSCVEVGKRSIISDFNGRPVRLQIIRSGEKSNVLFNPAVPKGLDPGGILVAVIDTGINYLLPDFSKRLARDRNGDLLGYDFWDDDKRPFDVDFSRSPFFPLHHGTAVTSIILREAPTARIAPYRFPRPQMERMSDVIAHAVKSGARIINLAMGSKRKKDWITFEIAARAHPELLFIVSAGNDGVDIDEMPLYPAALNIANMITVTSADNFGRLATGANWGKASVDIMVPGERVSVVDHRGVEGKASGSSFSVPRVVALAARWLRKFPGWTVQDLKSAILSRARPAPSQAEDLIKYGWIPDPTDDYLP